MQPGHLNDEGKQVINDGVQELVGHLAPRKRSYALQLIVDVQLQHIILSVKTLLYVITEFLGEKSHPCVCFSIFRALATCWGVTVHQVCCSVLLMVAAQ